jgi:uncharacterized membrane protein YfcA
MLTAGYGFVIVGRWFWWRINAWSEIGAIIGSFTGSMIANFALPSLYENVGFGEKFLFILAFCTCSWVAVTLCTRPTDEEKLHIFCKLVKPYRFGWKPLEKKYKDIDWNPHFARHVLHFFLGALGIFSLCFGTGYLIFKNYTYGCILLIITTVSTLIILSTWKKTTHSTDANS